MTTYGLTATGFTPKTLDVVREEINKSLRAVAGASLKLTDDSIEGQIVAILSEREAALWELAELVYNSQNSDAATGSALDGVCLLTGTFREPATSTSVDVVLAGTPTTLVPSGSQVATLSTGVVFELLANATIAALPAWTTGTGYLVGTLITNAGNVYYCRTAGVSASAPNTTAADITDGTVHWRYIGTGTGGVIAEAFATLTGPLVAVAGDVTEIVTPVGGWSAVCNPEDAEPGTDVTSDEGLRLLREAELGAQGSATLPALRSELLRLDDVIAATIFQNVTDTTDADGVPPHAVEALVRGGEDEDIAEALFNGVAAGIRTHSSGVGATSVAHIDSEGTTHTIEFTRPAEVPIYVAITLTKDATLYPADGDAQVKAAIVAWGNPLPSGRNAVSSAIAARAFTIPGLLDVTTCFIGTAPGPVSSATIAISLRQLATYDTSRITVTSTSATP